MTTTKEVPNIILGSGADAVTIYTERCEKVMTKKVTAITYPQSSANWVSGVKSTKIVDLLRIETRYVVRGSIDSADESKFEALMTSGGVFNMNWKSSDFNVNFDKLTIVNTNTEENDESPVLFTVIKGENL